MEPCPDYANGCLCDACLVSDGENPDTFEDPDLDDDFEDDDWTDDDGGFWEEPIVFDPNAAD